MMIAPLVPTEFTVPAIFIFVALLYAVLTAVQQRYKSTLRNIPGPELAKWTNLWRFLNVLRGDTHLDLLHLHRKYGKMVRIGPNVVSLSDPAVIPMIYDTKGTFHKTAFYPPQSITWEKRVQPNIFSVTDERVHTEMKRKVAFAYTPESLLKMEGQVDDCGRLLMGKLDEVAKSGRAFDLGEWLLYYTFDVVGETTFSEKLGFLETGSDVEGMIGAGGFMMRYLACVGQIPILHKLLLGNPIIPYLIPKFEHANTGTMFAFRAMQRRSKVTEHGLQMKDGHSGHDMLSRWAAMQANDPEKMNMTDVMVALATNIFAGADTTAISLRGIVYYLIKNPRVMRKLQEEIDAAFSSGKVGEIPTDREAREHLPYLAAVIKEALRIHPATGLPMERYIPAEGAEICGTFFPGGTIVGVNSWSVHYDPDVFPEPEAFRPERWLEDETRAEHLKRMERSFFAFGAGGRICMGRHLSMIEMRKIIPRMLRSFDLGFEGQDAEWKVTNAWFTPQEMSPVVVTPR